MAGVLAAVLDGQELGRAGRAPGPHGDRAADRALRSSASTADVAAPAGRGRRRGEGRALGARAEPREGRLPRRDPRRPGRAAPRDPAAGPPPRRAADARPAAWFAAGVLDFRRTMRASLSSGGVPMQTHHRPRRPNKTDLVVLCDLSESVTSFAHFTLLLVYALREQFTPGARVRLRRRARRADPLLRAGRGRGRGGDPAGRRGRRDLGARAHRLRAGVRAVRAALPRRGRAEDVAAGARRRALELRRAGPADADRAGRAGEARYWLNPERRELWDTGDSRASDFDAIVPMVECRNLAQLSAFVQDLGPR